MSKLVEDLEETYEALDCERVMFKPAEDLFEKQNEGIPEDFGKKDPLTTFQPVLFCLVCETEMSSIKTLGLHCEGKDHKKQVNQKYNQERLRDARIQVRNKTILICYS